MTAHDDPHAALAAVIAGFTVRLPERVAELAAAVELARHGDAAAVARARSLAHRLAGTAGSYGHDGAGRHAAAIEDQLAAATPDWAAIDAALAGLTARP